jgi:hypothetical protein
MWYSAVGCIVTLTLSFLAAPLAADAQPSAKVARIGYLSLARAAPLEEGVPPGAAGPWLRGGQDHCHCVSFRGGQA